MVSLCPVNSGAFISSAGACICPVGQYLVNSSCRAYIDGATQNPEPSKSEFIPPLPTAASWTNSNAQLISFEVTSILVGVWCLFCLGLRFAPLEGRWFRVRHWIRHCDVVFAKEHWFDEQKIQVKRRTEMGGALSLASLLFFTGLIVGMIWDLETQKQYTVESVVVASSGDIQRFNNDLDFNLTGYGSLRCEMLAPQTVTTGQVPAEVRTVPAISAGDAYSCTNNPDGISIRLWCPNCTAARKTYVISSEFNDLNGTQAYAVGWSYNVCAIHKSRAYKSCVSGSAAGASNGTDAPMATLRGDLPSVLSFRFFPRSFQQFDPELLLLESTFRQYTPGTFATDNANLAPLLAAPTGVRIALHFVIERSFIVITKSQSTAGVLYVLARAGGLFTVSYWVFFFVLIQFEKRIKRLRYDDKIINAKERQRIARLRWDKVRLFVKYSQFSCRTRVPKPGQVILDIRDVEAPRGDAEGPPLMDKVKQTLSKIVDVRTDEEKVADVTRNNGVLPSGDRHGPFLQHNTDTVPSQFGRAANDLTSDVRGTGRRPDLQRTASMPGGGLRQTRNQTPLPDFSLYQHIPPRKENRVTTQPNTIDRPYDYLLQHSGLSEDPVPPPEKPRQPARIRGGAPSPPESPPSLTESASKEFHLPGGGMSPLEAHPISDGRLFRPHLKGGAIVEEAPQMKGFDGLYIDLDPNRGGQQAQNGIPTSRGRTNRRSWDAQLPTKSFPPKRIHVSPPPRALTPPLPSTSGSSRPPLSPTSAADVSNSRWSRKRPKPIDVHRNDSEVSLCRSEPGSASTTPPSTATASERGHHRRASSGGSGVALLANIGRGLSRVIPGRSLPHLHFPGTGLPDGQKSSEEGAYERLLTKTRKKLRIRTSAQQTGFVVRRLKRPSWLGHTDPLPEVPEVPEDEDEMYNHLQDLYEYNVRLREDFLLAQSMLETVVERFRPHSDL